MFFNQLRTNNSLNAGGRNICFFHAYDYAFSLKSLFMKNNVSISLYLITESVSIFDTITAFKDSRKPRLINKVSDIWSAYKDGEITNVGWICSNQNIADVLTREQGNNILR